MASESQRRELVDKVTKLLAERFGGDCHKAFEHYDRDKKDGRINKAELLELLKDAGVGNWLTRGVWADGILAALDADKDGAISSPEFEAVLKG
jgi:Ca2+-binding EF-hand superfamily protein